MSATGSPGGPGGRGSLDEAALRAALTGRLAMWSAVRVVAETGSTNADALAAARDGAAEGLVIAAEAQAAGRGRLGRGWQSLPGGSLTFSVLLRPAAVPAGARGWLPLLTGVAVARAVRRATGVRARLKWPNDVMAGTGKLAGILAEQAGDAIVVGVGLNVLGTAAQLPVATATSLELLGAGQADRPALLADILTEIERWYLPWRDTPAGDADASGLRQEYLRLSATVGARVRVLLPGAPDLVGVAVTVDQTGRLIVRPDGQADLVPVSAGDVIHVR
ncbi:MAG: biotin--[acetyl-CoA-carboxylase] ligase [Streptosporangiaceae bacterium]